MVGQDRKKNFGGVHPNSPPAAPTYQPLNFVNKIRVECIWFLVISVVIKLVEFVFFVLCYYVYKFVF